MKMGEIHVLTILIIEIFVSHAYGFLLLSSGNQLEQCNVDRSQISVSGISSGAVMASQLHVIFSRDIMGVGLIAGVPFACSGGTAVGAAACMMTPSLINPTSLEQLTEAGAAASNIDDTANLAHDKVYIYNGQSDSVVNPAVGPKIEAFYHHFLADSRNIKTVYDINSQHGQPTDNYGATCTTLSMTDYLINCNYSAAYHLLNHIYGGHLRKPTKSTHQAGQLHKFSQDDFFYLSIPATYSMDTVGYVYIPSGCLNKAKKCKLHVALHGCQMGQSRIGDKYVVHGGYNEVGELNDIIILYPQAITTITNAQGCWDWFGYTGYLFATKSGFQPTAIKRMIDRISGG